MVRHLRIIFHLIRTSIQVQAQYRLDFFVQFALAVFWIFWNVAPLYFIFEIREEIAGWKRDEALLVMSAFLILKSVLEGLIMPNLVALVQHIRAGTFDFFLIKPADAQVLASFSKVSPTQIVGLSAGIAMSVWSIGRMDPAPSATALLSAAAMLLAGISIVYALWVGICCTAFWFVKIDNLSYLFSSIFDASRYPITVFRGWVRIFLTFIMPVAVMTSFPALALLGRLDTSAGLYALGAAAAALVGSRLVWQWAISHYSSASS